MPLIQPPINFGAIRAGLVTTLAAATGLPESQIIYEQPESMDAPRPRYPYVGVMVIQASGFVAPDFYLPVQDQPQAPTGLFTYLGERQMDVQLSAYARTHEQAYSVGCVLQALLEQIPTREALRGIGLTVWNVGDVTNISELLNTGYEGRSQLDASFALVSAMPVDMGYISNIPVSGTVDPNSTETFTVQDE